MSSSFFLSFGISKDWLQHGTDTYGEAQQLSDGCINKTRENDGTKVLTFSHVATAPQCRAALNEKTSGALTGYRKLRILYVLIGLTQLPDKLVPEGLQTPP